MAITSTLGALLVYGRFMKLIALLQPYHSTCWGFPAQKKHKFLPWDWPQNVQFWELTRSKTALRPTKCRGPG